MELPRIYSSAQLTSTVTPDDTAAAWGENFPPAASTPFLLAQAELASHKLVRASLQPHEVTVGTRATIEHLAPSRVGATIRTIATLVESNGRRFAFDVEIHDGERLVARVEHRRAVVDRGAIETALASS